MERKRMALAALLVCALLLSACGAAAPEPTPEPTPESTDAPQPTGETAAPSEAPQPEGEENVRPTSETDRGAELRVAIAFEEEADADEVIRAIEEALGHPLDIVWRLKSAHAISVRLGEKELEAVRAVEGVRSAEPEQLNEPQSGNSAGTAPRPAG